MNRDEEWLLKEKWGGQKSEGFFADCARLTSGEPLAYVIGHTPFLNTTIYLDSRPLIPRTETEFWVNKIIEETKRNPEQDLAPLLVVDLCAGSGCIGVAILKEFPMSRVDFAEIDAGHHSIIQKNIAANGIDSKRARIFGGNLFEHITDSYDLILSNPPYIDKTLGRTEGSVLLHEPHRALFAHDAGLAIIRSIINATDAYLKPNGRVVIEHEPEQSNFIHSYAEDFGYHTETNKDQYGNERYTTITRIRS